MVINSNAGRQRNGDSWRSVLSKDRMHDWRWMENSKLHRRYQHRSGKKDIIHVLYCSGMQHAYHLKNINNQVVDKLTCNLSNDIIIIISRYYSTSR